MATYDCELTWKELLYFFSRKKKCPSCDSKLKREKKVDYLGKGWHSGVDSYHTYGKQYEVKLFYRCTRCGKLYSIKELSGETECNI